MSSFVEPVFLKLVLSIVPLYGLYRIGLSLKLRFDDEIKIPPLNIFILDSCVVVSDKTLARIFGTSNIPDITVLSTVSLCMF